MNSKEGAPWDKTQRTHSYVILEQGTADEDIRQIAHSNVYAEKNNIIVLHHVILAFTAHLSALFGNGKIHSDFERGFIRAEIVDYATLLECGSFTVAKERGKVRSEGKDYVMQDNDVVLFRINV